MANSRNGSQPLPRVTRRRAAEFASRLLEWYRRHKRDLPWRRLAAARDPYRVWVSEIMLQQTQVVTVVPYYRRWLKEFPTVRALARATSHDVMRVWQGLGYYSRAFNLHRAAQRIVAEHGGRLPRDREALRRLPGIGRYTAGMIASIAYGQDAAALDGNVKRVLARVFDFREDVKSSAGERLLWELAERLVPPGQAGGYNQALMDLGATVCTPRSPRCDDCPVRGLCRARRLGLQAERPVVKPKNGTPHHDVTAAIVRRHGRVLITQRHAYKLLGGLWEFPGGKRETGETLEQCLARELREELGLAIRVGAKRLTIPHAFSHFRITLHVFECEAVNGARARAVDVADLKWVRPFELEGYPMGKADSRVREYLMNGGMGG